MYRGGNWNNGENAGLFYLNGNNHRSNSNTNIGFRSALVYFVEEPRHSRAPGTGPDQRGTSPGIEIYTKDRSA